MGVGFMPFRSKLVAMDDRKIRALLEVLSRRLETYESVIRTMRDAEANKNAPPHPKVSALIHEARVVELEYVISALERLLLSNK
jgi:hypothetical protein